MLRARIGISRIVRTFPRDTADTMLHGVRQHMDRPKEDNGSIPVIENGQVEGLYPFFKDDSQRWSLRIASEAERWVAVAVERNVGSSHQILFDCERRQRGGDHAPAYHAVAGFLCKRLSCSGLDPLVPRTPLVWRRGSHGRLCLARGHLSYLRAEAFPPEENHADPTKGSWPANTCHQIFRDDEVPAPRLTAWGQAMSTRTCHFLKHH